MALYVVDNTTIKAENPPPQGTSPEGCVQGGRVLSRQVQELDVAGLPLDQGADRGAVVGADDEVASPMAGLRSVLRIEATVMDAKHRLGESSAGADLPGVSAAVVASGSQ